jgi:hypothetical protein
MHTDGFEHLAAFVLDSDSTTVLTPSGFINYVLTGEVSMDCWPALSLQAEARVSSATSVSVSQHGRVRPSASKQRA